MWYEKIIVSERIEEPEGNTISKIKSMKEYKQLLKILSHEYIWRDFIKELTLYQIKDATDHKWDSKINLNSKITPSSFNDDQSRITAPSPDIFRWAGSVFPERLATRLWYFDRFSVTTCWSQQTKIFTASQLRRSATYWRSWAVEIVA